MSFAFCNLDFRLETRRVRDAREVRARRYLLAFFDRHELQHAVDAGTHFQFVVLALRERDDGLGLVDRGLRDRDLRARRFGLARELLLRDLVAHAKLLRVYLRLLQDERRYELVLRQLLVHLRLHLGLVVIGFDARSSCLLREQVVTQLHFDVRQRRFRRLQFELGVLKLLIELRIAQLENYGVVFDRRAGPQDDFFNPRLRSRWNPADVFRCQRSEAAHLAHHRPTFDAVGPDNRAFDGRRGRLQPRQPDRDQRDHEKRNAAVNDLADPLFPCIGRTSYIHGC